MNIFYLAFVTGVLSGNFASALTYVADGSQGQVVFKASALGVQFEGKGRGVGGEALVEGDVRGSFDFDMSSLDTGIEMRNSHMKDKYLEISKFPKGMLKITRVVGFNEALSEQECDFEGVLSVRDVQKPVRDGRVRIVKNENGFRILASFVTNISDFNMPIPKHAGLVVRDEVRVEAQVDLKAKAK